MHLDLPTLVVMGSFVAGCAGAVLLFAWSQNQKISGLAIWGLANLIYAAGILCLILGPALHQPFWSILSGVLLVLAPGLVWKAARSLDAKSAPVVIALLGAAVVGLASAFPNTRDLTGLLNLAWSSVYLLAAAWALWIGRTEHLAARWPIIILTAVHAGVLSIGAYSTFDGSIGQGELPPLLSLFGLIHFESIVFTLGTAVFILALVKERNEAASRMAANADPLTGIANRSAFMESAGRVMERCRRDSMPVSVMMFDLDRFKSVNDSHGHAVGDAVIRKFCELTAAALRPTDVFGRMGGEEFAVVLPGSGIEAAYVRAERISASFAEGCRFVAGRQVNATVSGGVSVSVNAGQTLSELLEYSDGALYHAKSDGRNRIRRADQSGPKDNASTVIRVA
jgi:diguanylate cyclase (GGDEF)-like protein